MASPDAANLGLGNQQCPTSFAPSLRRWAGTRRCTGRVSRRQSRYVASLTVGIAANAFFGIIRSALFVTLYRQRDQVAGLDLTAALTYVWVLQVVFGVVFVTWIWEFADSVRSGDFAAELVKPGAVLGRLLAVDLGRSSFALATRGLPQLVVAGIVLDLRLPTTPPGVVMLGVSLVLCAVAASQLRFLFGSLAFWTPDYRGWWTMLFGFLWFTGGFLVPVEFFPGALRWIGEHGPLAGLLAMPVRVATGRGAASALAVQACWILAAAAACHAVPTPVMITATVSRLFAAEPASAATASGREPTSAPRPR